MVLEVYTFGGGPYLFDVFQAIAAMMKGHRYISFVAVSATIGLMWTLLQVAYGASFRTTFAWTVSFLLFYHIALMPKVKIVIHDPLYISQEYQSVGNVPLMLGAVASFTSQVGFGLTTQMEMSFSKPDYMPYHKYGMLFGARIWDSLGSFNIQDENFALTLNSFVKQCVFYDLLLHKYTLDELKRSPNIWEFVTQENQPSVARSFAIKNDSGTHIKTCKEGAVDLKSGFVHALKEGRSSQGTELILSSIPMSSKILQGVAGNARILLQQHIMVNAMDRAATEFSNIGGANNIYTTVRSNAQTRISFEASRRQAETWVPLLRIVFEAIFYGAFPLVFLLLMLPIGPGVAKGYFIGFVWLQSWGPLYAVLNLIMSGYTDTQTAALGPLTIASYSGYGTIYHDVAVMAGYLAWFIPFIAAGIAKGALSVTGLSASLLAIPQSTATSAAAEVASGNINLGNLNLGNSNYDNISGNKMNASAFFDGGGVQATNHAWGISNIMPDGQVTYDQTASVSHLPNIHFEHSDDEVSTSLQTASHYERLGNDLSRQAAESRSAAATETAHYMASHSINQATGIRWAEHASSETRKAYNRIESYALEMSASTGKDVTQAFAATIGAGIGTSLGKLFGGNLGVEGSAAVQYGTKEYIGDNRQVAEQIAQDVAIIESAIMDGSLELVDSRGHVMNETIQQEYTDALRLEEQSRLYFDKAEDYTNSAQYNMSEGVRFGQDYADQFLDFVRHREDIYGVALGDRALDIIANKPELTRRLKQEFMDDQGINLHKQFQKAQREIGATDLNERYSRTKIENNERLRYNPDLVRSRFAAGSDEMQKELLKSLERKREAAEPSITGQNNAVSSKEEE